MDGQELEAKLNEISRQQKQILLALGDRKSGKDGWDKLSAIAPIMSGFFIASFGAYFGYMYNLQQIKLQEAQTIERFIPHLTGNEKTKKAAILAMSSLTNTELAAKMAALFASEGTASALQSIAETGSVKDRAVANQALAKTLESLGERNIEDGHLAEAKNNFKKALSIEEKLVGKNNVALVNSLDRLSDLEIAEGNYSAAEGLLKRSLAIKKLAYGDDPRAANAMRNLAQVLEHRGKNAEADLLYKEAALLKGGQASNEQEYADQQAAKDEKPEPKAAGDPLFENQDIAPAPDRNDAGKPVPAGNDSPEIRPGESRHQYQTQANQLQQAPQANPNKQLSLHSAASAPD